MRKLGRGLGNGLVFNSCASMRTCAWISNTHAKSQPWPQTLLGLVLWETETEGSRGLVSSYQPNSGVNETHNTRTHTRAHTRPFLSLLLKNLLPTNRVLSLGCELGRFSLCQNPSGIASCLMVTKGSQGVPVVSAMPIVSVMPPESRILPIAV